MRTIVLWTMDGANVRYEKVSNVIVVEGIVRFTDSKHVTHYWVLANLQNFKVFTGEAE